MPDGLEAKTALVTGASSGIGRAVAVALAGEGAQVAAGARRRSRLDELHEQLSGLGVRSLTLELDVTDEVSCRAAVADTVADLGALDILVNNAGVMLLGRVEGADTEDWRRMVATNVLGLMYMTHAALPHLLDRRGAVVQLSSAAGRAVRAGNAVYAATKVAVNAFSEGLRHEVTSRGLRVIVMSPGVAETELRDHITQPAAKEQIEQAAAGMRQLQPEDVAAAVVYALTQPDHVSVNEVLMRPTDQAW
jgi:clavulanate-9-aldehyde reductase